MQQARDGESGSKTGAEVKDTPKRSRSTALLQDPVNVKERGMVCRGFNTSIKH